MLFGTKGRVTAAGVRYQGTAVGRKGRSVPRGREAVTRATGGEGGIKTLVIGINILYSTRIIIPFLIGRVIISCNRDTDSYRCPISSFVDY